MTSNLGFSEEMFHKNKPGYLKSDDEKESVLNAIKKHFRPEFINRMDEIIYFDNLTEDVCKKLSTRYISDYQKKINMELSSELIIEKVVKDKDCLRYGARGIKRKVKKEILNQIETIKSI